MKESNMQTLFGKYIKAVLPNKSATFELKICKGNALPFEAVKEHQREALLRCQNGGFYHKLIDPPVYAEMKTRFNAKRPFDCLYLIGVEAFVVVWFYRERKPKKFIFIPIKVFLEEEEKSSRKSLTEIRAEQIGSVIPINLS